MPELLTNILTSDGYTNAATIGPALGVRQLTFQVFNQPIYAKFFKPQVGDSGGQPVEELIERYFPVGTLLSVVDSVAGAAFRSASPGLPATINAEIAFEGDALVEYQSSGLFSSSVLNLNVLHNNVLQGGENTLDFEDTANQIIWSVVDTPGSKVTVTPSFANPSIFPGDVITGTSALAVGGGPGNTLHATGTVAAGVASTAGNVFTATVVGDVTGFRFTITGDGQFHFGPGNAALDTGPIGRYAASVFGSATTSLSTGPFLGGFTGSQTAGTLVNSGGSPIRTFLTVATNLAYTLGLTTDTQPRFEWDGNGLHSWGPGGATAVDTTLQRSGAAELTLNSNLKSPNGSTAIGGDGTHSGFYLQNTSLTGALFCVASNTSQTVFATSLSGDVTGYRLVITSVGNLNYGTGGAASDVTLGYVVSNSTSGVGFFAMSKGAGIGYAAGAGGAVTQATSKSTGVTLNKPCGVITMNAAALAAGASVVFTLTNNMIALHDVMIVHPGQQVTGDNYTVAVTVIDAGLVHIRVTNVSGGSLSEALQINFALIKSQNA